MKKLLLDMLVCPRCLPEEQSLREETLEADEDEIEEGGLRCDRCESSFPIREGIANLDPNLPEQTAASNRYDTPAVLTSYHWSHFADLFEDEEATDAYTRWAGLMSEGNGVFLDTGSAVGRFSFEMAGKYDLVVGIDNSVTFVKAARSLMKNRRAEIELPEEGLLTRKASIVFPEGWDTKKVEFVVGDALALPFRSGSFSGGSSLNLADRVPGPLKHLTELNRALKAEGAELLFSDPFSWSTAVAPEEVWLGGTDKGPFAGRGPQNIEALLQGEIGAFSPAWRIEDRGQVWWKIRTHANHFEMIRSRFVKARR